MIAVLSFFRGIGGKIAAAGAAIVAFMVWLAGQRRAAVKEYEAERTKETLSKVEEINEARSDNRLRTDDELRDRLLGDGRKRR